MLSDSVQPHGCFGQRFPLLRTRHDDNVPDAKFNYCSIRPNVFEEKNRLIYGHLGLIQV